VSYALGVIAFVVALLLSVMLHEAGHFATAKAFGMKASRFFVGFGPTVWSFQRGETEYGVKAIPAGGFVKIEGMTQLEELEPGDEDRAFWKQPPGKRTIVLAAGSIVHFVIAILIVFGYLALGHQDPLRQVVGTQVAAVEQCISPSGACSHGAPVAPAKGRLRAGDRITAVDGTPVSGYDALVARIRSSAGVPLHLTVVRNAATRQVTVTPTAVRQGGHRVGKIGIAPSVTQAHVSPADAFPRTFTFLGTYVKLSAEAIGQLPHEVATIFEGKPRSASGAASVVGVGRATGDIAGDSSVSVGTRVGAIALIVAELNLFVGIFNLLPLLPLDGGHIAILAFEGVRSRFYRLLGRRDPGRVDIMKVMPLTYAVVAVFVGLSLILIYADIANPIQIQ
jgi:membrane-associated protease RseP (regulator of RpoE activity)